MHAVWNDLRFALRTLRKRPGFTAVAVATLALGIGANTALFSVIDAVLLTPLSYKDPERLVMVREATRVGSQLPVSAREFAALDGHAASLSGLAAVDLVDFHLVDGEGAHRVPGSRVTADLFSVLGVEPVLGRSFSEREGEPGGEAVVILGYGLWQRRFGGDPEVLGRELTLRWTAPFGPRREMPSSFTVIGVLPPGFEPPMGDAELFVPLAFSPVYGQDDTHFLFPFGRLADGVDVDTAAGELTAVLRSVPHDDGDAEHREESSVNLTLLPEREVGRVRPSLLVLWGAVACVLLIACANVAHLLLARGAARQGEMAVRTVLGASRRRLAAQLLAENTLLAAAGGVLGLCVAWASLALLRAAQPVQLPRVDEIGLDGRSLAFTLLLAMATSMVFGLVPAVGLSRPRFAEALKNAAGASSGARARRLRGLLVTAEVALALVLLLGAALLAESFRRLQAVDLGFDAGDVLTLSVALPQAKYADREAREIFFRQAQEKIEALPGVRRAAAIRTLPLSRLNIAIAFTVEGRDAPPGEVLSANLRFLGPGYFETMGIPVVRGRSITPDDVVPEPRVAIVNRTLASRYLGDGDPLGRRISLTGMGLSPLEIVGVVGDVRHGPDRDPRPTIYAPGLGASSMSFAIRTAGDPRPIADLVRREIEALDPEQPIFAVDTLEQMASRWTSRQRFNAYLMTAFSGLALVLALVGIYGVLAFAVARRTRELGVRMALGAGRGAVLRLVLAEGMRFVLPGLVLGLAAAAALRRFLDGLLFEVETTDPGTWTAATLLLLAVAAAAIWVPARRATRIHPVTALHYE